MTIRFMLKRIPRPVGEPEAELCNSCKSHNVRGGRSNRTFEQMKARLACGSMVRFRSFWKKRGSERHVFSKKDVRFHPAGGETSFRVSNRVRRVNHRMYAVGIPPGQMSRWPPAKPAAAWCFFFFVHKTKLVSSALPEAESLVGSTTA